MSNIAMLGGGFIGRFYADSLQGLRSKDRITAIYSRTETTAKKFADDYGVSFHTTDMEAAIARPEVEVVCIALPNNLHLPAVLLAAKHKKGVMCTKPLGRNADEAKPQTPNPKPQTPNPLYTGYNGDGFLKI
jgi:predicted dehydrogenase